MTAKRSPAQLERAALSRLIDTVGAEVSISLREHVALTPTVLGQRRGKVDETYEDCRDCGLRGGCKQPVAPTWPGDSYTTAASYAVVVESPDEDADRAGRHGVGKIGRTLRSSLNSIGLPWTDAAFLSTVGCWANNAGASRPARPEEVAACRQNLMEGLDAANVKYVLLLGVAAARSWRSDLTLAQTAGGLYVWQDRWLVMPTYSPQGVVRGTHDAPTWREHLLRFAGIVNEDMGLDALSHRCVEVGGGETSVRCTKRHYAYDSDGVPWCKEHFDKGRGGIVKTANRWKSTSRQGTLL